MTRASSEVLAKLILLSTTGEVLLWHAEAGKEAGGSRGPACLAGASLKLTLGMRDERGAARAGIAALHH